MAQLLPPRGSLERDPGGAWAQRALVPIQNIGRTKASDRPAKATHFPLWQRWATLQPVVPPSVSSLIEGGKYRQRMEVLRDSERVLRVSHDCSTLVDPSPA